MDAFNKMMDNIKLQFGGQPDYLYVTYKFFAAIGISLLVWIILKYLISFIEKRTQENKLVQISDEIFKLIKKVMGVILILVTGTYLIRLFNLEVFDKGFYAALVMFLAKPVLDFLKIVLEFLEKNIADKTETEVDNIIFDLLKKFIGVIVFSTAIIISLDILGINVMPFIAGAGVAGVAIGFAAKDTLSNLIAGVLLLIDRPFEIGDRIEVWSAPAGSATWGDVVDIGLRATKIKTTDNIIIIIPNNEIMTRDIVNYTINSSTIRVRVNIGVAYDTDIARAKAVILKIAETIEWLKKEPVPMVVVRNFGESSVDLQLRIWINNARRRMDTISYVTDKVKEAFDEHGIEIPYPKRDITIVSKQEAEVKI